jgi:type I restriction enzyme S subunit
VLAEIEGVCSTDILVLEAKPGQTTPGFLVNLLHTSRFLEYAISTSSGTNLPRTRWSSLRDYRLASPPLAEQRRIADALHAIQDAVAAQEDVMAVARELKRSLTERVFTYGPDARPAPTKETEIGEIPEHWELEQLSSVAKIGNGSTPKRTNLLYWENGTIPWLTSGKIHEEVIRQADEFVTELARDECHLPLVPKGSIVVAITGQGKTLGNAALVTFDTCINQHLAYVQLESPDILPEFVLAYLQRQYRHLRQMGRAGGSTKMALTCGLLASYLMPLPEVEEQEKVAHMAAALRNKVAAEEQRKVALEELFRSALEQLMTGQIRLKAGEET